MARCERVSVLCVHMSVPVHKCVCKCACVGGDQSRQLSAPHPQGPLCPRGGAAFPSQGAPRVHPAPRRKAEELAGAWGPGFGAEPPGAPGCGRRSGLPAQEAGLARVLVCRASISLKGGARGIQGSQIWAWV